ncbi:MAG TPA: hypothetical protein VHC40_05085 [Rhizomicrobium sp.]|nr:hypothetical protein [Rhizomicrobium sp.]
MIFRAVFWIGLVSLLAPHGPDVGLGRPAPFALDSSAVAAHLAEVRAEIAADRAAHADRSFWRPAFWHQAL